MRKISVFIICVEPTIHLSLCYLHDCTFKAEYVNKDI